MNLRHLEYLLAVADTGSFSRAAKRCRVSSQSALSRSIQTLEDDLEDTSDRPNGQAQRVTPFGQTVSRGAPWCWMPLS